MSRLPIQLALDSREALPGYLLRVSEANGYPMSYLMGELLDRAYPERMGRGALGRIGELTGLSVAEIDRLTLSKEKSRCRINLLGHAVTSGDCSVNAARVCPQCLAYGGVCHALWMLTSVTACPVHASALLDTCQTCQQPIRWSRTQVCFCRCGADFRLQASGRGPAEAEVGLASVFQQKLLGGSKLGAPWSHLALLDLHGLSRLTWVLAGVARDPWQDEGLIRSQTKLGGATAACDLLANWPAGFREFLNDAYATILVASPDVPRFPVAFRWAVTRLDANFGDRQPMIAFLVEEVVRFGAQHWSRIKLGDVERYEHALPDQFRWGSMCEAAAITGLQMGTLRKRINAGEVPVRRTIDSKPMRAVMVDLDWARSRLRSARTLGVRKAARHIGLTIQTLRKLRPSGIFNKSHEPEFRSAFSVEELDDLAHRLLGVAKRTLREIPSTSIRLGTLFDADYWSPAAKAQLLLALVSGRLTAVGRADNSILGIVVDRACANALLLQFRGSAESVVTGFQAAAALQTTVETVKGLRSAGYLERVTELGRQRITAESVRRFQKNYVVLSAVAGCRSRQAVPGLVARGIDIVELQFARYKCWILPARQRDKVRRLLAT